jgi:hypothetical protein
MNDGKWYLWGAELIIDDKQPVGAVRLNEGGHKQL